MVSSDCFCALSYHFVFFCAQLSGNFRNIAFFKKRVQKLGFSIFSVLSLNFENSLFVGLLKHYKNRGFSKFWCFLLLKEKKQAKQNDKWNFWIWVFWSKNGRFVTHMFFQKKVCWNPYFYSVLGCALFGPSCQKGKFWTPTQKRRNIWLITGKAHFWVFFGFSFFFFFYSYFFVFLFFVFFGRV